MATKQQKKRNKPARGSQRSFDFDFDSVRQRLPWGTLGWLAEGLALAGVLAGLALWLVSLQPDGIARVTVEGDFRHTTPAQLRGALEPMLQGGVLDLDLESMRNAVADLPWIDRVSVRRVFPAGVRVQVHEQIPVARWNQDGLLNSDGEVFDLGARGAALESVPADLPQLAGPAGSAPRVLQQYRRMSAVLATAGLHIGRIEMDPRHAWSLGLTNGIRVLVGKGDDGLARLDRLARVYEEALRRDQERVARVDLRYGNGFAVAWKDTGKRG